MKAEVNKSNELVITIPFDKKGVKSASGKSTVHASTRGNMTVEAVGFGQITIGLNAYSRK